MHVLTSHLVKICLVILALYISIRMCICGVTHTRVTFWGCYRVSQETPRSWSRRVPQCGGSRKVIYAQVFCFFPAVLSALSSNILPSRRKSLFIAVTLSLTCNLLLTVVQGLFTHPVLPYFILLGILPTCITFPPLEGFPISFLGLPSGIYIAS